MSRSWYCLNAVLFALVAIVYAIAGMNPSALVAVAVSAISAGLCRYHGTK